MKKAVLFAFAVSLMLTGCSVSTSSKSPLPDMTPKKDGPGGGSNGGVQSARASKQTTLASLEGKGALVALRTLGSDMYLSNGTNIGYRRASEIDVGIHGGSYCMFNPAKTASGSVMKIKKVQEGTIASPARNHSGVKITFEDGGSLHLIRATSDSTVGEIERSCLGGYAEFHTQ